MSRAEEWESYLRRLVERRELGVGLDTSLLPLDRQAIDGMRPRLDAALAAMDALESGKIANADEGRMVGHYWLRDSARAPEESMTRAIDEARRRVAEFARDVHAGRVTADAGPFEHVLHVGIGGSALGPQFLARALAPATPRLTIDFLDNTDPEGIDAAIGRAGERLARTLVTVVSKSGGTPETRNGLLVTRERMRARGLEPARRTVAITSEGSALDRQAEDEGWLARFPMWDWVGGRTSVTSAVGLLPAALLGIDVDEFLRGAREMDAWTRERSPETNPAALLAAAWYLCGDGRGDRAMVVLPYKDRLDLLGKFLQQLVMESLGKRVDRKGREAWQGLTVYGNKGSTDQHAYVQQLRDGRDDFLACFVQVDRDDGDADVDVGDGATPGDFLTGFYLGTRRALADRGRPSATLHLDRVAPSRVGAIVALFERAVGLYAELIDVNAYDQPGVEAGKVAAAEALELRARLLLYVEEAGVPVTAVEAAKGVGAPGEEVAVYRLLSHLAANAGRGVAVTRGESPEDDRFEREGRE